MGLPAGVVVRPFEPGDGDHLGGIWWRGFADGVPGVTPAHDQAEVCDHMGSVLPTRTEVWVAAHDATPVAFLAVHDDWVEQLYVDPPWIGRGVGRELLAVAKRLRPSGLQLWTFQVNARARRFYRGCGFAEVEWTDGSGNEERAPDVRLVWPGAGRAGDA